MKTKSYFSICLALAMCASAISTNAASHTWTGSVSFAWSNPSNWIGGAPQIGEANVILNFVTGATRQSSTNDIGNIAVDDIVFTGGNFTVGGYFITLTGAGFYNLACQQIADNAPITVNPAGAVDLNGHNETVGPLTMIGGVIDANGGTLTLNANVTGDIIWNNNPTFVGNLSLGGTTRVFKTLNPGAIILTGVISDGGSPAGIIKLGTLGGLRLDGTNNTYSGVTSVGEGWVSAE